MWLNQMRGSKFRQRGPGSCADATWKMTRWTETIPRDIWKRTSWRQQQGHSQERGWITVSPPEEQITPFQNTWSQCGKQAAPNKHPQNSPTLPVPLLSCVLLYLKIYTLGWYLWGHPSVQSARSPSIHQRQGQTESQRGRPLRPL